MGPHIALELMSNKNEPTFNILPHPAKGNEGPQPGARLTNKPELSAHNAKGPYIPTQEQLHSLGTPLTREELKKRAEELNKS